MRITDAIKGLIRGQPEDEEFNEYFRDRDGNRLYADDIVSKVKEDLQNRRDDKNAYELQWQLNANYYCGNQYCAINTAQCCIEQVDAVHPWMEHEVYNQIAPLIETRIANLKKINYSMRVKPRTTELDDYAKADVSTDILRWIQNTTDFNAKKNSAIAWNEITGNCFILSWWDTSKGRLYAEEQKIVLDEDGAEKIETSAAFEGDLSYGLLSPYEVFPESIFKQGIENQRSIIIEQALTVDDVFDIYGVKVEGETVTTFSLTPATECWGDGFDHTAMTIGTRSVEDACRVITRFERPSRRYPSGVLTIVLGDKLFYHGELPYDRIPLVQITCREVPGQFFGKSAIEGLIPLQNAYNGVMNRIHDYLKQVTHGGWWVEEGSIDMDDFIENGAEPGAAIPYRKGWTPPIQFQNSTIPPEILQERYTLKNDMEYVAGTSQLMVNGSLPNGVSSGTAIENLMNVDNTRLSLTGDNLRNAVKELAIMWLGIYKRYACNARVLQCTGSNHIGYARMWTRDDINSYDVEFTTENELQMSEETQKQRFFDSYNMGLFTDSKGVVSEEVKARLRQNMVPGDYSQMLSLDSLESEAAQRENAMFDEGVIPEVNEFDEHEIHIAEHLRYRHQLKFEILKRNKPEYARAFEDHIRIHKQAAAQAQMQTMQALMQQQQQGG